MELLTVSRVSKEYGVSTRMLRYYEQNGLIKSLRKEGYSYRLYDDANVKRLQQTIVLRKLQIPVKQICVILSNPDAATAVEIFRKNISGLDIEITALSTIKRILENFVFELESIAGLNLSNDIFTSDYVLELTSSLSLIPKNIKESITMSELDKAADVLKKLKNVRVVFIPPMNVISVYYTGDNSDERAWYTAVEFVKQHDLLEMKPDLRVFRISHANATGNLFGSEIWISVPDNFNVSDTFTSLHAAGSIVKKKFLGGQYAAHVIGENGFEIALGLQDWINENDKFQFDYDGNLKRCDPPVRELDSFGGMNLDLEEVLNFYNFQNPGFDNQIDSLVPIKDYIFSDEIPETIPETITGSLEKCGFKASVVIKNKFKIVGFTKIMTHTDGEYDCQKGDDGHCIGCGNCGSTVENFDYEIINDGFLDLLNKNKKPGSPVLYFGSLDMDSQIRGGWRSTYCLIDSDITELSVLMEYNPYTRIIDASKWLIFEVPYGESINGHAVCPKLGYTWNGIISGSFLVYPDGRIGKTGLTGPEGLSGNYYCWYPVK